MGSCIVQRRRRGYDELERRQGGIREEALDTQNKERKVLKTKKLLIRDAEKPGRTKVNQVIHWVREGGSRQGERGHSQKERSLKKKKCLGKCWKA